MLTANFAAPAVGCGADHDQHADLWLRDFPANFSCVRSDHHNSLGYTVCCQSPLWSGARSAPTHPTRSARWSIIGRRWRPSSRAISTRASPRRPTGPGAVVGFVLIVAIYVQTRSVRRLYARTVPDESGCAPTHCNSSPWPTSPAVHRHAADGDYALPRGVADDRAGVCRSWWSISGAGSAQPRSGRGAAAKA